MPTYGQTIRWTNKNGDVMGVTIEGRPTMKEAVNDAVKAATQWGWTYLKPYEIWRSGDTKPDLSLI